MANGDLPGPPFLSRLIKDVGQAAKTGNLEEVLAGY